MADAPAPTQAPVPVTDESLSFLEKLKNNLLLIGVGAWALAGIAAIIMSIVCFGFSGSIGEKAIGLGLAFFMGPLYFLFYGVNKNYCRNLGANVMGTANRMMGGGVKAATKAAEAVADAVSDAVHE